MSDFEVTIRVNPGTGRATIIRQGGAGGTQPPGQPVQSANASAASPAEIARQVSNSMRERGAGASGPGGGNLPWYLGGGLLGQASARMVGAALDPHMSGAEQQSVVAREGARAAGYGATKAAITMGTLGAGSVGALGAEDTNRIAEAVGNAVGAAVEKALQRRTETQGAATRSVQSIAAQYARAGKGALLDDGAIDSLLARETAANERAFDIKSRVAGRSGNMFAGAVNDVQKAIGETVDSTLGGLGLGIDKSAIEKARRMAVDNYRDQQAIHGSFNR